MRILVFALFTFIPSLLPKMVQISWEATPGADTNVLTSLITADFQIQLRYLNAIMEALESSKTGDIISEKTGLKIADLVVGYSAWEGKIGAGAQTYALVDIEEKRGGKIDISEGNRRTLNQYCAILGYLLRQDAVIWYYEDESEENLEKKNGFQAKFNQNPKESDFKEIYHELDQEFKTWDLAPGYLTNGFNVLNFESKISNTTFQQGMKNVMEKLETKGIGAGLKKTNSFRSIGDYISNNWTQYSQGEEYFAYVKDTRLWDWAKEMRKWRIDVVNEEFEPRNTIKYFLQKA